MMNKKLKKYRVFLLLLLINLVVLLIKPAIGIESFTIVGDSLIDLLSVVPPIFILIGLLDTWIEKTTMTKYMGKGSGIKGIIIAFFLGSVAAGPLYVSFPAARVFIGKGARLSNVLIFVGAWSTTKIPLMIFEATSLGARFTIIRFLLNLPVIFIIAFATEKLLNKKDMDEIYRNCEIE